MLIGFLFRKVEYGLEKLPIIQMKHFPFKWYSAMMWCCKLIDNERDNVNITDKIMNHEMIHYQQICSIGSNIRYYLTYIWEWIKCGMIGNAAYYLNPLEIEAYVNELNPNYKTYKGKYKLYKTENGRKLYCEHRREWKTFIREYFKDVL